MPPESNGDYLSRFERLERLAETHSQQIGELVESAKRSQQEHDRIWKSIEALHDKDLDITAGIKQLTSAIRDLIDRIPPENLR